MTCFPRDPWWFSPPPLWRLARIVQTETKMLTTEMTDGELMERFEDGSIPADCFHHLEHVRVAFLYLCRFPIPEALQRFTNALKRFAAAQGKADRYHETISWAYMLLVQERMTRPQEWDRFAAENPDLLNWKVSILKSYYREETLKSEKARRVFVLPDKQFES